jgi:Common central domain of tyrosinase
MPTVPASPSAAPARLRHRRNARSLTAGQLAGFRRAITAAQALKDERGYQAWAGIHGLPLPVSCTHNSPLFLPWHRAYLYFFEKALQDRVAGVTLPWWNWTMRHAEGLPAAYRSARPPTARPARCAARRSRPAGASSAGRRKDHPYAGRRRRAAAADAQGPSTGSLNCRGADLHQRAGGRRDDRPRRPALRRLLLHLRPRRLLRGDVGHCDVPTGPRDRFDLRPPHQLIPAAKTVIVTDAFKRLAPDDETLTVTVIAVAPGASEPRCPALRHGPAADLPVAVPRDIGRCGASGRVGISEHDPEAQRVASLVAQRSFERPDRWPPRPEARRRDGDGAACRALPSWRSLILKVRWPRGTAAHRMGQQRRAIRVPVTASSPCRCVSAVLPRVGAVGQSSSPVR